MAMADDSWDDDWDGDWDSDSQAGDESSAEGPSLEESSPETQAKKGGSAMGAGLLLSGAVAALALGWGLVIGSDSILLLVLAYALCALPALVLLALYRRQKGLVNGKDIGRSLEGTVVTLVIVGVILCGTLAFRIAGAFS